jgi:hypothetical protein
MKHIGEEQLVLYYYGEPENAPELEQHLAECETCRGEYQAIQRVLNSVDSFPVPERAPDYEQNVWQQVALRLGSRSPWPGWLAPRHWVWAGAIAALVIAAFFTGRGLRPPQRQRAGEIRERVLLVAVGNHLERSQMVLTELANADPLLARSAGLDISFEQSTAEDLLEANRLYRQTAASAGDAGATDILDDLERALLEIAHSPSRVSAGQLEDLKREIGDERILIKVKVFGSQLRRQEAAPDETKTKAL